ncbi:MAG: ATP phosphoribosyltransferase regulatory subunit [Pseudomonadota bacterium]
MTNTNWMLPEGIDEFLPPQAWALESLRKDILQHFWRCGYDLVHPPVIEYIESLLVGTGRDFDLQTFKLVDQLSGRTLGVRADMTPQVARIDAHQLKKDHPVRLCYLGSVLRSRPEGLFGGRNPLQLGAELYGHTGVESDAEVLALMIETLQIAGIDEIYLDIGHVGVFRSLADCVDMTPDQSFALFELLQRKAQSDINDFLTTVDCDSEVKKAIGALIELNGGDDVLDIAECVNRDSGGNFAHAITYLRELAALIRLRFPNAELHFDLAELRGYHYHTGVVFAAYQKGQGNEIARGGRYDEIGEAFGRARPATGFSTDLKSLIAGRNKTDAAQEQVGTFASTPTTSDDWKTVNQMRAGGKRVICELPGQSGGPSEQGCKDTLTF